jgi:hypothetical protein
MLSFVVNAISIAKSGNNVCVASMLPPDIAAGLPR